MTLLEENVSWRLSLRIIEKQRTLLEILLVGEYQQQTVLHFSVVDDAVQLLSGLIHTGAVGRVDDEDETLGACKVKYN